jgi:hypothetical protein
MPREESTIHPAGFKHETFYTEVQLLRPDKGLPSVETCHGQVLTRVNSVKPIPGERKVSPANSSNPRSNNNTVLVFKSVMT